MSIMMTNIIDCKSMKCIVLVVLPSKYYDFKDIKQPNIYHRRVIYAYIIKRRDLRIEIKSNSGLVIICLFLETH